MNCLLQSSYSFSFPPFLTDFLAVFFFCFILSSLVLTFTVDSFSLFDKRQALPLLCINKKTFAFDLIIWWGLTDLCLIYKPRDRCTINPSTSDPDSFIIQVKREGNKEEETRNFSVRVCKRMKTEIKKKKKKKAGWETKKKKSFYFLLLSFLLACFSFRPAREKKENEKARGSLKCTSHMRRLGNSISSSQGERCVSEQIKGSKKFITKQTETYTMKKRNKTK